VSAVSEMHEVNKKGAVRGANTVINTVNIVIEIIGQYVGNLSGFRHPKKGERHDRTGETIELSLVRAVNEPAVHLNEPPGDASVYEARRKRRAR
jgi:hypothetical protein